MGNRKITAANSAASYTIVVFYSYYTWVHFSVVWGEVCFVFLFFYLNPLPWLCRTEPMDELEREVDCKARLPRKLIFFVLTNLSGRTLCHSHHVCHSHLVSPKAVYQK